MRIDLENLLIKALNEGCSLFTGAGFSLLAQDIDGQSLPIGVQLEKELITRFNLPNLPLPKLSTILEKTKKEEFNSFLIHRFTVGNYNDCYNTLEFANLKYWFTTNIDNLPQTIFHESNKFFVNDNSMRGPSSDKSAIEFYPLHGNIANKDQSFIFTTLEIATTFKNANRFWNDLAHTIEKYPTIFWGYSLNDSGILETLSSISVQTLERKHKWIILHEDNPAEETYLKALGFNIIIAQNEEFLRFIQTNGSSKTSSPPVSRLTTKELLGEDFIPTSVQGLRVRELNEFYLGDTPIWSDIFSKQLYLTSHYHKIQNLIFGPKNIIVLGTPASGKTTLLMQLAAFTEYDGQKILLDHPSIGKCRLLINRLGGAKAIFFLDNFTDDIESLNYLSKIKSIRVVAFDREHEFEIVSHLLERRLFQIHNVTDLSDQDIQEIFSKIPGSIRNSQIRIKEAKSQYDSDENSLFEFININISFPHINERFKNLLERLEKEDNLLTDFLILSSYIHKCHVPLTFDMAHDYFRDLVGHYKEIFELRDQLGDLIKNTGYDNLVDEKEDYFVTRSLIVSEAVIEQCNSKHLKRVLYGILENLPKYRIANYNIFKKKAYDKRIMVKAFQDPEEGKYYYERLLEDDDQNPYLWQQGALYLAYKKRYFDAFIWIEQAISISDNKIFTIRNSHAIILFEANIKKHDKDSRPTLDRSMNILQDCYIKDRKKLYHAKKFAEQAMEYYRYFPDNTAKEYLTIAQQWVREEMVENNWDRNLKFLQKRVDGIINYI